MCDQDADAELKSEILRLTHPKTGRANRLARWELVLTQWEQGRTAEEIGLWIDRHPSTVLRLIKRAALERQKRPGFTWPTDSTGKKICDIAHPMPSNENPKEWAHARLRKKRYGRKILGQKRTEPICGSCPVCRKGGILQKPIYFKSKPLIEVLM